MEAMMNAPGGPEVIVVLAVAALMYGVPIAVAVWIVSTLAKIRRDVVAIRRQLEASQR